MNVVSSVFGATPISVSFSEGCGVCLEAHMHSSTNRPQLASRMNLPICYYKRLSFLFYSDSSLVGLVSWSSRSASTVSRSSGGWVWVCPCFCSVCPWGVVVVPAGAFVSLLGCTRLEDSALVFEVPCPCCGVWGGSTTSSGEPFSGSSSSCSYYRKKRTRLYLRSAREKKLWG